MVRSILNSLLSSPNGGSFAVRRRLASRFASSRSTPTTGSDSTVGSSARATLGEDTCSSDTATAGNRVEQARLLASAGFEVLLFDYRGYGRSSGRPSEGGTYRDARSARDALLRHEEADEFRLIYLGESLGGAVALALALEAPPFGLVLQSASTSVRDMAREHYPYLPRTLIPDEYPSLRRVAELRAPLLKYTASATRSPRAPMAGALRGAA